MEIAAFLLTVIVGLAASSMFGNWLNWPDAGAVFAIATVGAFLLRAIRQNGSDDNDSN